MYEQTKLPLDRQVLTLHCKAVEHDRPLLSSTRSELQPTDISGQYSVQHMTALPLQVNVAAHYS